MPARAKKATPPEEAPKKPLSRSQMKREPEMQFRQNTRETLKKFWKAIDTGLESGDSKVMKIVSEMYNMTRAPGGISIYNTQVSGAGAKENEPKVKRFDAIIGLIESADSAAAGAEGVVLENSEPDEEIEEGEFEDLENDEGEGEGEE